MNTWSRKLLGFFVVGVFVTGLIYGGYWVYYEYFEGNADLVGESLAQTFNPGPLRSEIGFEVAESLDPDEILRWTNYYREEENLSALTMNNTLSDVAVSKADDMFAQQYFEHESPDGLDVADLVERAGYDYALVGENLAMGGYEDEKDLVDAWMDSLGHRENIMRPEYSEIGISAVWSEYGGDDLWMSVQTFATPAPECDMPSTALSDQIDGMKAEYAELDVLVAQYNVLVSEGQDLVDAGNAKIEEGNRIAQGGGGNSAAQSYWDEGSALQVQGQTKIDKAEDLQAEIDRLQELYNTIQLSIDEYNIQVKKYNGCVNQYN